MIFTKTLLKNLTPFGKEAGKQTDISKKLVDELTMNFVLECDTFGKAEESVELKSM